MIYCLVSREDWLEDSLTTEAEDLVLGNRLKVKKKILAQGHAAPDVGVMYRRNQLC